jgi:hypothetical protein
MRGNGTTGRPAHSGRCYFLGSASLPRKGRGLPRMMRGCVRPSGFHGCRHRPGRLGPTLIFARGRTNPAGLTDAGFRAYPMPFGPFHRTCPASVGHEVPGAVSARVAAISWEAHLSQEEAEDYPCQAPQMRGGAGSLPAPGLRGLMVFFIAKWYNINIIIISLYA